MELLINLYEIHSPSGGEKRMKKFIRRWVRRNIPEAVIENDHKGNIYVTKGVADTYPCVVSHVDQVQHNHSEDFKVYNCDGILCAYSQKNKRQEGLGADDKNGIWVCLKALEHFDVVKCAFFVEEEIGCGGSCEANFEWFNDCRFVLQCDRRNGNDLITQASLTELCSEDFLQAINYQAYGYVPTTGMLTDVLTLKESGVNVSMLNISCGYYEPHTDREVTIFEELENCRDFVFNIIENCTDVYPHEFAQRVYHQPMTMLGSTYGGWYGDGYDDWRDWHDDKPIQSVGDVIEDYRDSMYDWEQEYDVVYDSVWAMLLDDNTRTANDIYNEYRSCLTYLELQDIEAMVEDIKNELMINEL
jgi:hypothetical protein